ncbi:MAG: Tat pathway signal sequence [Nocardioidaceae bacterium]
MSRPAPATTSWPASHRDPVPVILRALVAALVLGLVPAGVPADASALIPTDPGRPVPATLRGVTTESITRLGALDRALRRHEATPTVRVVFQAGEPAASYAPAVRRLRRHAYLLGQPFDSTATRAVTVDGYRDRVASYVARFGDRVDLWEIGNELNGSWVGLPKDIDAKVAAAFDVVEKDHAAEHLRSVITLNYWPSHDCYAHPWEATVSFARQLPRRVRHGVDYVLLSFYETACSPRAHPTDAQFRRTFRRLGRIFPHARLGMGEVGAQRRSDGLPANPSLAEKQRIARRYYGLQPAMSKAFGDRWVGGYFWWYYYQDAVTAPRSRSLWPMLDRLLARL